MSKNSDLIALLKPTVESMAVQLWGIELLNQGKSSTLRIYIETDTGVDLDDCERVSKQVSALLDVENPIPNAYTLEVSSPGMDRLLYNPEQYQQYAGAVVKVKLRHNFEGQRNFKGQLAGVEDGQIILRVGDDELLLPFELLDRVQVVPKFD